MSGLLGKKNSTLKKESIKENRLLSTGVKAIKFWHEAGAGETSIPFGSLNMPTSISGNGFSNPTSAEIIAANLGLFHTNVEVNSSVNQKLIEGLNYIVKNNQITFANGYVSVASEIFEVVYKNDVITGTNVVDARPLTATGVLTAGLTDFNVGEAFKTNQYPATQLGEVLVFVDGIVQFRNVGNATAAPAADGNYEEVHSTGGFGTIIRFNDVFATDKNIIVVSRNLIAERPDISMIQLIESLGGQLDAVIETTAALAGVPETDFQAAPNQVDLKAFGDTVTNLQKILDVEVFVDLDETVTYTGYISQNGTNQILFKTEKNDSSDTYVSVSNTDHTRYTFLKECDFVAVFGNQTGTASSNNEITMYDSSDTQILTTHSESDASGPESCAMVTRANVGDYITARNTQGTVTDNLGTNFSVKTTAITKTKISDLI